jgi:Uncharacterized conserved protein
MSAIYKKKRSLLAFAFVLAACSDIDLSDTNAYSIMDYGKDSVDGFVKVHSTGSSTILGTRIASAKHNERPEMTVSFTYDFAIQKHEVTCKEFNKILKSPKLDCKDNKPATDVTFYDAVLYANALSKKAHRDSAYTYSSASFDSTGHCKWLGGYVFKPTSNGFRLPTEAEWNAAATINWDPKTAWNADNSNYRLHDVCSGGQADAAICDMAGNAMEWVNDWMGNFADTTLKNFVGPPDGGNTDERVVKGGSFRKQASNMNLYSRGDIYTVTSKTRADYVGFRLAYGSIPDATWMGRGAKPSNSRVSVLTGSSYIRLITGSNNTKLVFRNDISGNLEFIDYSLGDRIPIEIVDTIDSYHPDISPDGKYVAFCTGYEGASDNSALYVRKLDSLGSGLVKLDVKNAVIPRWYIIDSDTVIVFATSANNNRDEGTFKKESTWLVKFENGKFGKPRKLFQGAYHGGITNDLTLAVSGSQLMRARIAPPEGTIESEKSIDTVWYADHQICNVSLSRNNSPQIAFLSLGSQASPKTEQSERAHEYIHVTNLHGRNIKRVKAPEGYTFDHTEWTNNGKDMVATLTTQDGVHEKIVHISSKKNSITSLVEGEELWHPCLWTKERNDSIYNNLSPDSIGMYMTEESAPESQIMKVKMDMFWQYRDSTEAIIIGSSRSFAGIDPMMLIPFAINISYSRECLTATNYFIENYVIPLTPKLKYIILALDYDRWFIRDESYNEILKGIPGYIYDEHHNFWHDEVPQNMAELTKKALQPEDELIQAYSHHRGIAISFTEGWGPKNPDVENDPDWFEKDSTSFNYNFELLEKIIDYANREGIIVVGVVFPQSPYFVKNKKVFGRYGLSLDKAEFVQSEVNALTKKYPNFYILDEYKNGKHDYKSKDFGNADHLNLIGAETLSFRLSKFLFEL